MKSIICMFAHLVILSGMIALEITGHRYIENLLWIGRGMVFVHVMITLAGAVSLEFNPHSAATANLAATMAVTAKDNFPFWITQMAFVVLLLTCMLTSVMLGEWIFAICYTFLTIAFLGLRRKSKEYMASVKRIMGKHAVIEV